MFRVKVYVGRLTVSKHGAQDDGGRLGLVRGFGRRYRLKGINEVKLGLG